MQTVAKCARASVLFLVQFNNFDYELLMELHAVTLVGRSYMLLALITRVSPTLVLQATKAGSESLHSNMTVTCKS